MPDLAQFISPAAPWLGLSLLALIFLANALGVLDQSIAAKELVRAGVPASAASVMVWMGRVLQLIAVPCLFVDQLRAFAAIALALFLIGATMAAHAFWKVPATSPVERGQQLVNFLKNVAIVGGLCLAAGWRN